MEDFIRPLAQSAVSKSSGDRPSRVESMEIARSGGDEGNEGTEA
jgi:hypothetical protein